MAKMWDRNVRELEPTAGGFQALWSRGGPLPLKFSGDGHGKEFHSFVENREAKQGFEVFDKNSHESRVELEMRPIN